MRARDSVYHLSCFTCSTCNKTLTTGDHFGMKDSLVYCRAHFETLLQGEYPAPLSYTELAAKGGGLALPYFNGTGTVQKGRPRKRKSPALGVDIVNYNSGGSLPTPSFPGRCCRRGFRGAPCCPEPGGKRPFSLLVAQMGGRSQGGRGGVGDGEGGGRERNLYLGCGKTRS